MTEPITPDGARALIAEAEESLALVGDGDWTPQDSLLRRAAAALEASLPREDADLGTEIVENAARAMFEDPDTSGDYTWAEMAREDTSRADIWREDARRVLTAAGLPALLARVRTAEAERDLWRAKAEAVRSVEPHEHPAPGADLDIEGFVQGIKRMLTNETHAWNLWNVVASDTGPIRAALETVWDRYPLASRTVETAEEWEYGIQWTPGGRINWGWDLDELTGGDEETTYYRRHPERPEHFTPPTPEGVDRG